MQQLIECVPNFSEGRNLDIIRQITDAIESVEGIRLLDVDPGKATNRTVVTFVGPPEQVCEAAYRAIVKANELIDMQQHKGEHPRFGAVDVCPLVPVAHITMEETAAWARKLAQRVGETLQYPIYLYESAATSDDRRNLSKVRAGEYEGLPAKLADAHWKPDFGPAAFVPKTGATAIGARDFLIAVNFNLNTTSTRRANAVAFDVREAGRVLRKGDPVTGEIVLDENSEPIRIPGKLKACKAIGWFIEEYGVAQISMNITNIGITPLHKAFEAVEESARARGMRVTGTELVGLVPLRMLTEAGKYFLEKQERSVGVSEAELIKIAVRSMGLDDLKQFEPEKKVIEYMLRTSGTNRLASMSLQAFAWETASEAPAPGGGSISAYVGTLGIALGAMVANLSAHKRGWDDRWAYFSGFAEEAQHLTSTMLHLVDEDTRAFDAIMQAFALPKETAEEREIRKRNIQAATKYATEVPLSLMRTASKAYPLLLAMAKHGNPNSVSDAGVGALCITTAIGGALLNVQINAGGYHDKAWVESTLSEAEHLYTEAKKYQQEIWDQVQQVMRSTD
jgi:glutamate formiminotransferase/formiminotetrahydrofolate cyclodeaminase